MKAQKADMRFIEPTSEEIKAYEKRLREICPKFVKMAKNRETFLFLHMGPEEEEGEKKEQDYRATCIMHGDQSEMLFLIFGLMDELDDELVRLITGKGYMLLAQASTLAGMPVQGEA